MVSPQSKTNPLIILHFFAKIVKRHSVKQCLKWLANSYSMTNQDYSIRRYKRLAEKDRKNLINAIPQTAHLFVSLHTSIFI